MIAAASGKQHVTVMKRLVLSCNTYHNLAGSWAGKQEGYDLVRAGCEQGICDLGVGGAHVELEAIWWLCHHLQCPLQNADRKLVCGLGSQPQPEVLQHIAPPSVTF